MSQAVHEFYILQDKLRRPSTRSRLLDFLSVPLPLYQSKLTYGQSSTCTTGIHWRYYN